MLHINDLVYRIEGRQLFDRATAHIPQGHRIGLVGRNGTGKSTLLKLIVGDIQAETGNLSVPPGAKIGYVRQDMPDGALSPVEAVLAADEERVALLAEAETAEDPARIADIHNRLADIRAHTAPARAATILAGLGFDEAMQNQPLSDFSGGWQMRVALAATLFLEPDLLLLDEPTNHLDLEASLWLLDHLKSWPGTMIIVSHDRDMLNDAVTGILHVDQGRLVSYSGNYDRFERTRREAQERQSVMLRRQEKERARLQAFVDKWRASASNGKQAQSRLKMLQRMEPIAAVVEETSVVLNFPKPDILPSPLIHTEGMTLGYEEKTVLRGLDLRIDSDDRIALLGANGNGKSTLAKFLAGRLRAMDGNQKRLSKLKTGYFAQHQLEELDENLTALQQMQSLMPDEVEQKVRSYLGNFGFPGVRADVKVANLSGGEKARLAFAAVAREKPNMLILDEPTNHLDVDARQALVESLADYDGAVILISHDRHLVELVADRLWIVKDGTVSRFDGDMDEYARDLVQRRRQRGRAIAGKAVNDDNAQEHSREGRQAQRADAAAKRAEQAPMRKRLKAVEARIEKIDGYLLQLAEKLEDPTLYEGPPEKVTRITTKQAELEKEKEALEEEWLELEEALA